MKSRFALKFYPLGREQVIALRERLDTLHRQKAEQYTMIGG
jgi:hypothetical protein